jgi:hypothetical protein
MPRLASSQFTIPQLESMLQARMGKLESLQKDRNALQRQIDAIDEKIRDLGGPVRGGGGGGGTTASGRARNERSLTETIAEVLEKAGKPASVGEILDGVRATGYRSNSANFRGIINQTLIKERKRFANAGRGMYGLKK